MLGNVLASVDTINICFLSMFLRAMTQEREAGRSYSCRRSTRGGSYEMHKAQLQVLARKFPPIGQADISFINHPKIALVQTRGIVPTYTPFACVNSTPHTSSSLSPSTASQPSCTTTGQPPTVKKLLLLVVILVRVRPLESSSTTVGSVTGSTRWIGKNKKVTAVTLHCVIIDHRLP